MDAVRLPARGSTAEPPRTATLGARLRRRFRPPRRLSFLRGGRWLAAAILAVGLGGLNTGNNLLYLLLGGLLGLVVLSGWLSEQAVGKVAIRRRIPRALTAGQPARLFYTIHNGSRRWPSYLLEIREREVSARAFVPLAGPGEGVEARGEVVFPRRGVYTLGTVTVGTSYPFGFFRKERDLELPGLAVVWPRTDRGVREPRRAGAHVRRLGPRPASLPGGRGDYRGLRPYRPGDDPRDVHWRTTARLGDPVIREYDREDAETLWICLDLAAPAGDVAEEAVEIAAALASGAVRRGERFGLATPDEVVPLGAGPGHLELVLDALARAEFRPRAPGVQRPADPSACVLVTAGRAAGDYGDRYVAAPGG
ncbi:MAG TPA: DUF58 domain-containing protein [Longimicrobiales bacterium]|nr:DUF58 domain-containing protein [Longimicrobiales bacterium]